MRRKNGFLVLLMSLVLIASCVLVAMAGQNASQTCQENDNFGVGHDTCVVCLNPSESTGNQANCICKIVGDLFGFPFDFGGTIGVVKNHGQCIKAVKPFFQ